MKLVNRSFTLFLRLRKRCLPCSSIAHTNLNVLNNTSFVKLCRSYAQVKQNEFNLPVISQVSGHSLIADSKGVSEIEKPSEEEKNDVNNVINTSVLQDVSHYAPPLSPSFNLAAYANKSPLLQEFVKLGVELYKFDKNKFVAQYILGLDFERDVKKYLMFLHDNGVPADSFGRFITKNPFIFKEDLDNLQVRINYLLSKKFSAENVSQIITKNPKWLSVSAFDIDDRLGYFQKTFNLTGADVRHVANRQPRLITYKLDHIKVNIFSFKEEMGFSDKELKVFLLEKPKLFMKNKHNLITQFNYVHNEMKIPHELIVKQPEVLLCRPFRTEQRHRFLVSLGKAQYDPKLPGYVSLKALVSGTDVDFCRDVTKSTVDTFNLFMKTL